MINVKAQGLSIRFPIYGASSRSLKKHLVAVTIGGRLGLRADAMTPIVSALNNVSLQLDAGDRLALVGPNGSGKTTLLRALSGVYSPDEGFVEVNGRIASLLDLSLGIDPSATGIENIRLRGLVAGLSSADIATRLNDIAEFSGLGAFLGLPVKTYSAGMQARLAFAAATSVDADILMMDEWIAVGDSDFVHSAQKRLLDLVEKTQILVLASHNIPLVQMLCNKFIYMDHGAASKMHPIEELDEYLARREASIKS